MHRSKAQMTILLVSAASGRDFKVKKAKNNYARPVAIDEITTPTLVPLGYASTHRLQLQDRVEEIARVWVIHVRSKNQDEARTDGSQKGFSFLNTCPF